VVRRVAGDADARRLRHPHAKSSVGSRPSRGLVVGIGAVLSVGILLPFTPVAPVLGFAPLPPSFFAFLGAVVLMYLVMVETLKSRLAVPATAVARG